MKLRSIPLGEEGGRSVAVGRGEDWVPLAPLADAPWSRDLLALLCADESTRHEAATLARDGEAAPVGPALLPFAPRSLRAFSIYPTHMEQAARVLAKRFFPAPAGKVIQGFEGATKRTFPALKPKGRFFETPAMYMGNHTAFVTDGETVPWPTHSEALDYELELGFVLGREVENATPAEGEAAIAGFFIVNDWSARDVQADDYRNGLFGPVVKSKTFNNAMGPVVATADELSGRAMSLEGSVWVNGERWSENTTAGAAHDLGDLVAYASRGERLGPGDVFAAGTVSSGAGMELDRWVQPGDQVELRLEELGSLTNTVGPRR